LAEDLADVEEQNLLASLAENLSHAIDAIEQERARQMAERKLELASHVFENSAEGVMITDRDNKILMVNRRFSEITGYTAEEVAGNTPNILNSGQQDKSFYSNMWRSLTNRGEWHGEIRNRRKDGEVIVEWMNISAVKNDAGEIINYVAVFSEITVHKTIKKRMQFLAHYDALTSLPNRILFSDRFEQAIIAARRKIVSIRSTRQLVIAQGTCCCRRLRPVCWPPLMRAIVWPGSAETSLQSSCQTWIRQSRQRQRPFGCSKS
jgi:PAS domain S-box-containing protein